MPTYQYACTECGHTFDQFQSFSDDTLTECPQCAGRLRKLFNAVGVVFKGSGFYRNDSRGKAPSEGSESAPAAAATTSTSGDSSSTSDSSTTSAGTPAKPAAKSTSSPQPATT